ncbi:MAG TPA: hypothetical protein VJN39_14000 [Gemmatimonadales bacterium]|nr:hypothetical protein [Gemmatimonadales bacterium]
MHPTEGSPHVWARLRVDVNCALRRGAWYRVVRLTKDTATLDVIRDHVQVRRRLLQTAFEPPSRRTIVPLPKDAARVPREWGNRYAVCPACHTRAPIQEFPPDMRCPQCRGVYGIAWDEHYLNAR